jgi:hypothetical protein
VGVNKKRGFPPFLFAFYSSSSSNSSSSSSKYGLETMTLIEQSTRRRYTKIFI